MHVQIARTTYDDMALPPEVPNFDMHVEKEHNVWAYVNFLAYLMEKDSAEYDGREQYVANEIKEESLKWLPNRTSGHMERLSKTNKELDKDEDEEEQDENWLKHATRGYSISWYHVKKKIAGSK